MHLTHSIFKTVFTLVLLLALSHLHAEELTIQVTPGEPQAGQSGSGPMSLSQAQQTIRQRLAEGKPLQITVRLAEGYHALNEPLIVGREHIGAHGSSIIYSGEPGKKTIIGGGVRLQGRWEKKNDKIWTIELPAQKGGWHFRDLFADGRRLTRARYPNAGEYLRVKRAQHGKTWAYYEPSVITLKDPLPPVNVAGQEAEFVTMHEFSSARARIRETTGSQVKTFSTLSVLGHPSLEIKPNEPCYIEHALDFLDVPGEWYVDQDTSRCYLIPPDGKDPNQIEFHAPLVEQLLLVRGERDRPVRNVHFKNISFQHTHWELPLRGYNEVQATNHGTVYMQEPTFGLQPAIYLEYAENCSFSNCTLAHTGAAGIAMGRGCRANAIDHCELFDIGGCPVMIGWREKADEPPRRFFENDWSDPTDAPLANLVTHNEIHHSGVTQFGAVGIYVAFSPETRILHNDVHDMPYTGISVGYRWNAFPSTQRDNIIAYNRVHDVMQLLDDGGGIYMLGLQPGTQIHHNLIHDVRNGDGIYTDEGSSQLLIENNICHRIGKSLRGSAYHHHYGHHNVLRNNIFSDAKTAIVHRDKLDPELSLTFENNIVVGRDAQKFMDVNLGNRNVAFDSNLYWDFSSPTPLFGDLPFQQWQEQVGDRNSLIADPQFKDPDNLDFSFPPHSPALKIGFKPIDLSRIGPQ